jgi:hypothetical protein
MLFTMPQLPTDLLACRNCTQRRSISKPRHPQAQLLTAAHVYDVLAAAHLLPHQATSLIMQPTLLVYAPAYSPSEPSQLLLLSGVSSPPPIAGAAAAAAAACSAAAAAMVLPAAVLGLLPATLLTLLPGTAASPSAAVPVLAAAGESQRRSAMSLRSAAALASALMRPACSFQKSTCLRNLQITTAVRGGAKDAQVRQPS